MKDHIRTFRRVLGCLALLSLALFPPGPTRAHAQQADPPPAPFRLFLPLAGNPAAAPDLIFEPAELTLGPGTEASVAVRVQPAADLRGATFELPGLPDG